MTNFRLFFIKYRMSQPINLDVESNIRSSIMIKCGFDLKWDNNEAPSEEDSLAWARGCCWMLRPMAGRLLLALCQADESRVNVGICSLKLQHRGNTDQLCRQPQDLLIANQHLHSLCLTHTHTHTYTVTHTHPHTGWLVTWFMFWHRLWAKLKYTVCL